VDFYWQISVKQLKEEKISNIDFQKIIVRMINELKEEKTNELKQNINKQLTEIKKTRQDMKKKNRRIQDGD
jgi:hypothetical protein